MRKQAGFRARIVLCGVLAVGGGAVRGRAQEPCPPAAPRPLRIAGCVLDLGYDRDLAHGANGGVARLSAWVRNGLGLAVTARAGNLQPPNVPGDYQPPKGGISLSGGDGLPRDVYSAVGATALWKIAPFRKASTVRVSLEAGPVWLAYAGTDFVPQQPTTTIDPISSFTTSNYSRQKTFSTATGLNAALRVEGTLCPGVGFGLGYWMMRSQPASLQGLEAYLLLGWTGQPLKSIARHPHPLRKHVDCAAVQNRSRPLEASARWTPVNAAAR